MAMGSRGRDADTTSTDPGPDPMTSMLEILGDPEALAARIKELKAATAKSVKALEKAKAAEAELDARAKDLDVREQALETQALALNARTTVLDEYEKTMRVEHDEAAQLVDQITKREQATAKVSAALTAEYAQREEALAAREAIYDEHVGRLEAEQQRLDDLQKKLIEFERRVKERQHDIEARYEKLKELVG
jgi:DNA repair exonuclease SbcCD ATPase subunit